MNRLFRNRQLMLLVAALLGCSGAAYAACRPNNCAEVRDQCVADGGSRCEIQYYRCLQSNGCPIP